MDDESSKPKKAPGTGRGSGRKPGSKNKLTIEVKQSMAQFFEHLTAENLAWRQRLDRIFSSKTTTHDDRTDQSFRAWSGIALDRTLGTPAKAVVEKPQRDPVLFVSAFGHKPWCWAVDAGLVGDQLEQGHVCASEAPAGRPLGGRAGRSAQMIKDGDAQRALEAADRKAAAEVVIDHEPPKPEAAAEAAETLEIVQLPEPAPTFEPPGRERDRGRS